MASDQAFIEWMDSVAAGSATMSQRNMKWVDANGGVEQLIETAKSRGVHLVQLTDDKGRKLVAASTEEFATLC